MRELEKAFINGYATIEDLKKQNISLYYINKYIDDGSVTRIRKGLYKLNNLDETNEVAVIAKIFPDAIICMDSALFTYNYSDRTPSEWHLAVDKDSSKSRFNITYPFVKPYYYEPNILSIGIEERYIYGVKIKIYDKERVICDCIRSMNKIDRETFNKAIQGYIADPKKNIKKLIDYSKKLKVYNKVKDLIGVWL